MFAMFPKASTAWFSENLGSLNLSVLVNSTDKDQKQSDQTTLFAFLLACFLYLFHANIMVVIFSKGYNV